MSITYETNLASFHAGNNPGDTSKCYFQMPAVKTLSRAPVLLACSGGVNHQLQRWAGGHRRDPQRGQHAVCPTIRGGEIQSPIRVAEREVGHMNFSDFHLVGTMQFNTVLIQRTKLMWLHREFRAATNTQNCRFIWVFTNAGYLMCGAVDVGTAAEVQLHADTGSRQDQTVRRINMKFSFSVCQRWQWLAPLISSGWASKRSAPWRWWRWPGSGAQTTWPACCPSASLWTLTGR